MTDRPVTDRPVTDRRAGPSAPRAVTSLDRHSHLGAGLAEMAPLLRRVIALDPRALARVRAAEGRLTVLVQLPFAVLVARTVPLPATESLDQTVAADELLGWLDRARAEPPVARDSEWRGAVPPARGWQRVDLVPGDVIRRLVRTGAQALEEAVAAGPVPGAQPRAEVADALLDSVVLTAEGSGRRVEVRLRTLSALTRMGFLARGSAAAVDVCGRWVRVAAAYGSVFAEPPGGGLGLLRPA